MRVISGTARGKKLNSLQGLETRPTLDRVKEAIFNILQFNLKGAVVLDLFSGSGALAIESLSRGASKALICDNSYKSIKIINKNLEETRLIDRAQVLNNEYTETLKYAYKNSKQFDIIFLDPPYKSNYIINSLNYIIEFNLLKNDGIIVIETNDKNKIEEIKKLKKLEVYDIRKYGIVIIIFIRKG